MDVQFSNGLNPNEAASYMILSSWDRRLERQNQAQDLTFLTVEKIPLGFSGNHRDPSSKAVDVLHIIQIL